MKIIQKLSGDSYIFYIVLFEKLNSVEQYKIGKASDFSQDLKMVLCIIFYSCVNKKFCGVFAIETCKIISVQYLWLMSV